MPGISHLPHTTDMEQRLPPQSPPPAQALVHPSLLWGEHQRKGFSHRHIEHRCWGLRADPRLKLCFPGLCLYPPLKPNSPVSVPPAASNLLSRIALCYKLQLSKHEHHLLSQKLEIGFLNARPGVQAAQGISSLCQQTPNVFLVLSETNHSLIFQRGEKNLLEVVVKLIF